MGVIKLLFPAVNECVTMVEHWLWGWQVLPDGNNPLRDDQGTRSWATAAISLHRFFFS